MKQFATATISNQLLVAPRTGAWIETKYNRLEGLFDEMSRLAQARGLKRVFATPKQPRLRSRLAQARGLKLSVRIRFAKFTLVAPRTGAWIETNISRMKSLRTYVAPRTGAWIETCRLSRKNLHGASRPVQVRGLKLLIVML